MAVAPSNEDEVVGHVLAQLVNEQGEALGTALDLPLSITTHQLQLVCNSLISGEDSDHELVPYTFTVHESPLTTNLHAAVEDAKVGVEQLIRITCHPQATFRVRSVTRCTSSLAGHADAVVSVSFGPRGHQLASGSGDTTVRLWDVETETPLHTCKSHIQWVLCVAWSPDGTMLASADKAGIVCIWDGDSGKQIGKPLKGHSLWVNSLSWQPVHSSVGGACRQLASASKDTTVRIWDAVSGLSILILTSHTHSVTCVKWGGMGLIYTASQDRTVKVWRAVDGVLCRTLTGHAHWVNTLALSTEHVLRTGAYSPTTSSTASNSSETPQQIAERRYKATLATSPGETELLVSGSDDFTMFLWHPVNDKKAVARLTGHQQLINDVKFSPDGRKIASASFDKSVKLWSGEGGKFLRSLRGHVQAVYQLAWSSDSRLICSASADSTLKVWDVDGGRLLYDLPGHSDEVYAVDWSSDGQRVASGGKDKVLKLWRR